MYTLHHVILVIYAAAVTKCSSSALHIP